MQLLEPFEGELASTSRKYDIEGVPLPETTQVYHAGFYEQLPTKVEEAEAEPGLVEKITGIFAKRPAHPEFPPVGEAYLGPLATTSKAYEVEGIPLQEHVSVYHSGRSDEAPPKVEAIEAAAEPTEGFIDRVTGLFKRKHEDEYPPITEPYAGPIASTSRYYDVEGIPIEHLVSVYHSGRSDEVPPKVEKEEKEPTADLATRLAGFFKKTPAHQDYPVSERYEGELGSISRAYDVEGVPLTETTTAYHVGHYETLPTKPVETEVAPEPSEGLFGKVTGIFKKHHHEEFPPISEPYYGPLADTHKAYELEGTSFDVVGVVPYHPTGRSDEPVHKEEPTKETTTTDVVSRLTGFFKRGPAHMDYPVTGNINFLLIIWTP